MFFQLRIAFLNVLRNRRRSIITLAAIVFGVASLIIFGGYISAMHEGHRESIINSQYGHIQIYKKGFNRYDTTEPDKYLLSTEDQDDIHHILENLDHIEMSTPRLNFSGLITNGTHSVAIVGSGVDADTEAVLSSSFSIVEGEDLFSDSPSAGLIGAGLFRSLNAEVGDYLTLLSSTADGAVNAVDIQVSGVLSTGLRDLDNIVGRFNLEHIQDLMYTDSVTRILILLADTKYTEDVSRRLEGLISDESHPFEIRTWSDLAEIYHEVVEMYDGIFFFIKIIVLFIVALSISNTMLMSVMERTREIGAIRAIGSTRFGVVCMITSEAFILGIAGCLVSVGMAYGIAELITSAQFMMPTPPGSTQTYPIRIFVEADNVLQTSLAGLTITVVSSFYPAIRASRLVIVQALRFA